MSAKPGRRGRNGYQRHEGETRIVAAMPYDPGNTLSASKLNGFVNKLPKAKKQIMTDQCSLTIECRVCKNLFRKPSDFIQHKQKRCKLPYAENAFKNTKASDFLMMKDSHAQQSKYLLNNISVDPESEVYKSLQAHINSDVFMEQDPSSSKDIIGCGLYEPLEKEIPIVRRINVTYKITTANTPNCRCDKALCPEAEESHQFDNVEELARHIMQRHPPIAMFKTGRMRLCCLLCDAGFVESHDMLNKHVKAVHDTDHDSNGKEEPRNTADVEWSTENESQKSGNDSSTYNVEDITTVMECIMNTVDPPLPSSDEIPDDQIIRRIEAYDLMHANTVDCMCNFGGCSEAEERVDFGNVTNLSRHIMVNHPPITVVDGHKVFGCLLCDGQEDSESKLIDHLLSRHAMDEDTSSTRDEEECVMNEEDSLIEEMSGVDEEEHLTDDVSAKDTSLLSSDGDEFYDNKGEMKNRFADILQALVRTQGEVGIEQIRSDCDDKVEIQTIDVTPTVRESPIIVEGEQSNQEQMESLDQSKETGEDDTDREAMYNVDEGNSIELSTEVGAAMEQRARSDALDSLFEFVPVESPILTGNNHIDEEPSVQSTFTPADATDAVEVSTDRIRIDIVDDSENSMPSTNEVAIEMVGLSMTPIVEDASTERRIDDVSDEILGGSGPDTIHLTDEEKCESEMRRTSPLNTNDYFDKTLETSIELCKAVNDDELASTSYLVNEDEIKLEPTSPSIVEMDTSEAAIKTEEYYGQIDTVLATDETSMDVIGQSVNEVATEIKEENAAEDIYENSCICVMDTNIDQKDASGSYTIPAENEGQTANDLTMKKKTTLLSYNGFSINGRKIGRPLKPDRVKRIVYMMSKESIGASKIPIVLDTTVCRRCQHSVDVRGVVGSHEMDQSMDERDGSVASSDKDGQNAVKGSTPRSKTLVSINGYSTHGKKIGRPSKAVIAARRSEMMPNEAIGPLGTPTADGAGDKGEPPAVIAPRNSPMIDMTMNMDEKDASPATTSENSGQNAVDTDKDSTKRSKTLQSFNGYSRNGVKIGRPPKAARAAAMMSSESLGQSEIMYEAVRDRRDECVVIDTQEDTGSHMVVMSTDEKDESRTVPTENDGQNAASIESDSRGKKKSRLSINSDEQTGTDLTMKKKTTLLSFNGYSRHGKKIGRPSKTDLAARVAEIDANEVETQQDPIHTSKDEPMEIDQAVPEPAVEQVIRRSSRRRSRQSIEMQVQSASRALEVDFDKVKEEVEETEQDGNGVSSLHEESFATSLSTIVNEALITTSAKRSRNYIPTGRRSGRLSKTNLEESAKMEPQNIESTEIKTEEDMPSSLDISQTESTSDSRQQSVRKSRRSSSSQVNIVREMLRGVSPRRRQGSLSPIRITECPSTEDARSELTSMLKDNQNVLEHPPVYLFDDEIDLFFKDLKTKSNGQYICGHCGDSIFTKLEDGLRHMTSHMRIIRYKCSLCGVGAFYSKDLLNHLQTGGCQELPKQSYYSNTIPHVSHEKSHSLIINVNLAFPGRYIYTSSMIVSSLNPLPHYPLQHIEMRIFGPKKTPPRRDRKRKGPELSLKEIPKSLYPLGEYLENTNHWYDDKDFLSIIAAEIMEEMNWG